MLEYYTNVIIQMLEMNIWAFDEPEEKSLNIMHTSLKHFMNLAVEGLSGKVKLKDNEKNASLLDILSPSPSLGSLIITSEQPQYSLFSM